MCGISGIYYKSQTIDLSQLKQMTDVLAHRGPDGDGHWLSKDGNVGLAHRRLSIIDLSERGKQPMQYGQGRYTITFNGEIYNYLEVKEKLLQKGYQFHSDSDTEVLMAAYADKGERCLEDLDGMFAFALYDQAEKKLFCARDRFGEKPFYYYYIPNQIFAFASEMKALWALGIPKNIKDQRIYQFLIATYVSNPTNANETFFENIYKLGAAHYLTIDASHSLKTQRYWQISHENIGTSPINFPDACEQFEELFTTSVKRRLRADVPVGSSLSGGLDSSAVVCCINELNKQLNIKQKTFSARFHNFAKDEGKFMQYVINATSVEPHFVYPSHDKMIEEWDKLMYHQEEPVGSASIYAQWCVMHLAKENGVIVLLDGQGADEILAGYHPYYNIYWNELKSQNPTLYQTEREAFQILNPPKVKTWRERYPWHYVKYRLKKLVDINAFLEDPVPIANAPLLYPEFDRFQAPVLSDEIYNSLNQNLYFSTFQYGLEDLLRYADRNSMAHSREVRLPFLNHELVEFVFSLPPSYKIGQGWTKYLQRKSFEKLMPPEITWRKDKIGYEPPQQSWFAKEPLKSILYQYKNNLEKERILNPKHQLEEGDKWKIFMLGHFLDKNK
jgi:asparagine synthase (glutamine-hydrolysing)